MSETIILDPSALQPSRQQIDITSWIPAGAGIDWGDAAIEAYMADQTVGSSPVDFRLPNRQVKIPLILKDLDLVSYTTVRSNLQRKVGTYQRAGGWLQRTVGTTALYADVVNATLHLGGSWLAAFKSIDVDAVLSLETLPEFYGDEITLDSASTTGVLTGPLQQSAATAQILGDIPGRVRVKVSETSGNNQLSLLFGFRSRHYDSTSTAALNYQAENLTPLNGAAVGSVTGASGTAVTLTHPGGLWVPMLQTNLVSGNLPLTHQGTYRVWARVYSAANFPKFQLLWGVGSLSTPEENAETPLLPVAGSWYLVDLGTVRIDPLPVGSTQWFGVIQAFVAVASASISIDQIYLQPLDETAGKLTYSPSASPTKISTGAATASTVANDATSGTVDWSAATLGNIAAIDSAYAAVPTTAGQTSHWLKATNFGFNIPAGATITGIQINAYLNVFGGNRMAESYHTVRTVKAGTINTGASAPRTTLGVSHADDTAASYGNASNLWGLTWTPADINNTGFGAAIQFVNVFSTLTITGLVNYIGIIVYYTLATGFVVSQDAVVYANQNIELRNDGIYRVDPSGGVYGQASNVIGDLPRIPPSGLEALPVEVFVKPSRSDLATLPDAAVEAFGTQVIYRPSYLFVT